MAQTHTDEIILLKNIFQDKAIAAFQQGYECSDNTKKAEALAEQLANINAKYMGSDCYLYYFIQDIKKIFTSPVFSKKYVIIFVTIE